MVEGEVGIDEGSGNLGLLGVELYDAHIACGEPEDAVLVLTHIIDARLSIDESFGLVYVGSLRLCGRPAAYLIATVRNPEITIGIASYGGNKLILEKLEVREGGSAKVVDMEAVASGEEKAMLVECGDVVDDKALETNLGSSLVASIENAEGGCIGEDYELAVGARHSHHLHTSGTGVVVGETFGVLDTFGAACDTVAFDDAIGEGGVDLVA